MLGATAQQVLFIIIIIYIFAAASGLLWLNSIFFASFTSDWRLTTEREKIAITGI